MHVCTLSRIMLLSVYVIHAVDCNANHYRDYLCVKEQKQWCLRDPRCWRWSLAWLLLFLFLLFLWKLALELKIGPDNASRQYNKTWPLLLHIEMEIFAADNAFALELSVNTNIGFGGQPAPYKLLLLLNNVAFSVACRSMLNFDCKLNSARANPTLLICKFAPLRKRHTVATSRSLSIGLVGSGHYPSCSCHMKPLCFWPNFAISFPLRQSKLARFLRKQMRQ